QIVKVVLLRAPLPRRDDDIARDALLALRPGERQFAFRDALGPLAEGLVRRAAEIAGELAGHLLARLAGLDAAHPRHFVRMDSGKRGRHGARRELSELVAADAPDVLHLLQPVD